MTKAAYKRSLQPISTTNFAELRQFSLDSDRNWDHLKDCPNLCGRHESSNLEWLFTIGGGGDLGGNFGRNGLITGLIGGRARGDGDMRDFGHFDFPKTFGRKSHGDFGRYDWDRRFDEMAFTIGDVQETSWNVVPPTTFLRPCTPTIV